MVPKVRRHLLRLGRKKEPVFLDYGKIGATVPAPSATFICIFLASL
jgi:hypothetical protein